MRSIDRISALPNEVRVHILSLMPTKDAVRTTVLSKRWINLWTAVPNLYFSDEYDSEIKDGVDPFATFVSRVLYFRDSIDIQKCSLLISTPHNLASIADWICTIARRNVIEFEFTYDIYEGTRFSLFSFLFMCKTLRILKLNLWDRTITVDPPTSGCFPSLKVLHLGVCSEHVPSMQKFFSRCPVLEVLTMDGLMNFGLGVVPSLHVSAPELRTLIINFDCERSETRLDVFINTPKLVNIELRMDGFSNYFLMGRAKTLVSARIGFPDSLEENPCNFSNQAIVLFDEISNVKYLSLAARWSKEWRVPAFVNLNRLSLVLWDCNYWEVLLQILQSAPKLEEFVLENKMTKCERKNPVLRSNRWNPPEDVPICLSSHLKSISISGFNGRQVEVEMANYLLANGSFLKNMTITDLLYAEDKDLYKEFMMFNRATS